MCRQGGEPFGLTWANLPRAIPCGAKVPCEYKVTPTAGVVVDSFSWTFGDATPVVTKEPTTKFTYAVGGTYAVHVRATSRAGGLADLRTTETLCTGGLSDSCDVATSLCCEGACIRGICK